MSITKLQTVERQLIDARREATGETYRQAVAVSLRIMAALGSRKRAAIRDAITEGEAMLRTLALMTAEGELVRTSELETGDVIRNEGCLMQIGPINSRFDDINGGDAGPVVWTRARVIHRGDDTIPLGWFDRDEDGHRTWTVQGNDRRRWMRVQRAAQAEDA